MVLVGCNVIGWDQIRLDQIELNGIGCECIEWDVDGSYWMGLDDMEFDVMGLD